MARWPLIRDVGAQWDDWIPFLHPDEQEEGRNYWSNCLRTGQGAEHNYRVRDAQGNYRWFLTRAEPLRASDGTLLLWIGVTLDIDEAKKAEETNWILVACYTGRSAGFSPFKMRSV